MSAQAELAPPAETNGTLNQNGTLSASEGSPPPSPSSSVSPPQPTPATTNPPNPPDPLTALRTELEKANTTLATLTRERTITRALFEAGAIDLDIASVLIDRELTTHPKADPVALVAELIKRKPLLFRRTPPPPPHPVTVKPPTGPVRTSIAALSAMAARTQPADPFAQAAHAAAQSGNRASLLAYMRLKRQPAD